MLMWNKTGRDGTIHKATFPAVEQKSQKMKQSFSKMKQRNRKMEQSSQKMKQFLPGACSVPAMYSHRGDFLPENVGTEHYQATAIPSPAAEGIFYAKRNASALELRI
ncbi:hypothetical protein [Ectobacillus ponti]|uniref:Uncharacterized protein n=1 Tax=Ectobacillus ponti TaxID=2961894 RepID=A0AA42BV78_9BACI|nr:hypothetical protein [Ectobacillus ponti]MCP8971338.1 hypothetical protein [Ectobacillus ponti]